MSDNLKHKNIRPNAWFYIKKALPFLLSLVIVLYILSRIDQKQFIESIRHARIELFFPLMIFFVLVWFFIESQNLHSLMKYYGHGITYSDSLKMRGITYVLMIINYALGVGGMAVYLNRMYAIPFKRSRNLMIVYTYVEIVALSFMSIAGCAIARDDSKIIGNVMIVSVSIFLTYVLIYMAYKHLPEKGIFGKIKNLNLVKCFCEITYGEMLILILWRGIYFSSFILFFYVGFKTFGVRIPMSIIVAYTPIIFFIGSIPFTPFGLGTIQAAMMYFFKDYGLPSQIFAFSLIYSTMLILLRVPIGLFYARNYKIDGVVKVPYAAL